MRLLDVEYRGCLRIAAAVVVLCFGNVGSLQAQEAASATKQEVHDWTPAEIALKEAMEQDATTTTSGSENCTQTGAIAAWKRFLARKDATDEHRVFAYWRLGSLYAYNYNPRRGEKADKREAEKAFTKAINTIPGLVSEETLNAASVRGTLAGPSIEKAKRLGESYRWFATRTEKMICEGAERTNNRYGYVIDKKFWATLAHREDPPLEAKVKFLKNRLSELRESREARIVVKIRYSQAPYAISMLLKSIEDVAPPKKMKEWRRMAVDLDGRIGLQRMLDDEIEAIDVSQEVSESSADTEAKRRGEAHHKLVSTSSAPSKGQGASLFVVAMLLLCGMITVVTGALYLRKRLKKQNTGE